MALADSVFDRLKDAFIETDATVQGGAPALRVRVNGNIPIGGNVTITSAGSLNWGSSGTATPDVFLYRDKAATLAQRNGATAQNFRVYNTFTAVDTDGEWISVNFTATANTATIQTNAGSATGTVRAITIQPVTQTAATTAGANVSIIAGIPSSGAVLGGTLALAGGAGVSNNGGAVTVTSGAAGGGSNFSGTVTMASGAGVNGTSGSVGNTGAVTIQSGTPGTATTGTAGTSGAIIVQSRNSSNATGAAGIGGASGAVTLQSGSGGAATNASSGVGGAAGTVSITGGNGGAATGSTTGGAGASVVVTAGNGGNGGSTSGLPGSITLTAGSAGTGGNVAGGNITLVPGVAVGSGAVGRVVINGGTGGALVLKNTIGSLATSADEVQLGAYDLSAGNATLSISTETAVAVDVIAASTHSLSVRINGTTYKILLST